MDGKTLDLDKHTMQDKDTDSEASDTSINKNSTKRPRVDYSPKEKSPSPAESPIGKSSLADTAPPLTSIKIEKDNGDASMAESPSAHHIAGSSPPMIFKFDLPPPLTTQELEQKIGENADGNGDSDNDKESTKFLSSIIKSEENKEKRQVETRDSASSDTGIRSNGTSPTSNSKKTAATSTSKHVSSGGKPEHQPNMTSSPVSDLVIDNRELEITMTVRDPSTGEVILDETIIKSDTERMDTFLRQHNMKLSAPSQLPQTATLSGNLGDIENSNSTRSNGSGRWSISSLGTTIPIRSTSMSRRKGIKGTRNSGHSSAKKPAARRRVGRANNFPITNAQTPASLSAVLSTPPPARSLAKIEGTQAKPLSKFEQELNSEPVIESELQKSETLWSAIFPLELVFARWCDRNYYSGMVQSKGLNSAWVIDFDDGMKGVASENHIIPIRILGVGVNGIYTPDDRYEPKDAVIIGQKFQMDSDTGRTAVKYAIKCDKDAAPIWCSRRQLCIRESDAKKLRPGYTPSGPGKPTEISIDNIVGGQRARRQRHPRLGESTPAGPSQKRVVGGALDASSTEEKLLESSTPKAHGTLKGEKKTPATDSKEKRSSNASTPQTEDPSTSSSPVDRETPAEDPTILAPNSTALELGQKKTKKTLFQGMQFYVTALGPGRPRLCDNSTPFDKDEYCDLIVRCGGEILDTVGKEEKTNVFLISDSYARTLKYIYCLAAGIPCVSHCWINKCLKNLDIIDWDEFTLPAGWSLEHNFFIPRHVRKPLKDCKIFVKSVSDQLYNYWKPVLTAAEAIPLKSSREKGTTIPSGTEIVVTDQSDPSAEILAEAEILNVPVVKPEWLVQTLITGQKARPHGHVKYMIGFNETK